MKQTFEKKYNT